MEMQSFRRAAFGGFVKQDVIDYIEKSAREAAELQEKLQAENARLKEENGELTERAAALQEQLDRIIEERNQLTASLEEETAHRKELESVKPEAERLTGEVERLRPDAEAYAQFRENLGAIECDARKRAADMEKATVESLQTLTESFRARYQVMVADFDTAATHVTAELRKMEVNLTHLPRNMDQVGTKLKELEELLDRIGEK